MELAIKIKREKERGVALAAIKADRRKEKGNAGSQGCETEKCRAERETYSKKARGSGIARERFHTHTHTRARTRTIHTFPTL